MAEIHLYPQVLSRKCLFKQKTSGKLRGLLHIDHIVPCEIAYLPCRSSVRCTRNNPEYFDLNLWHHRQLPVGCKQKARPLFALIRQNPCSNAERQ